MKELVLVICMLQGVIDSQNDGVITLEVSSTTEGVEPIFVHVSNEVLPVTLREGDDVRLTIFTGKEHIQYCSD